MYTSKLVLIPEQLRIARLARGLSLEELGESVAATRQYIHQLETNSSQPTDEMVKALADVLGVTSTFLCRQYTATVRPEQCHFRKQATTPAYVISQVLARGTILDRLTEVLESYLELPAVNFLDFSVSSNDDIEQAAEAARKHWNLKIDAPIKSMMRVVENAGAIVTYFDDLSERVDAFSMDRKRPVIVRSSLKESFCRQRFDLAHETGHLVMHRGIQTGDHKTEEQAHRFAGAFLIPRPAMIREFPRSRLLDWNAMFKLKLRWGLSVRALARRAYDLGIINTAQYRTANIHLVKTGQTKVEKFDDQLAVEEPELMSSAFESMQAVHSRSARVLADDLGLGDEMFTLVTGQVLSPDSNQVRGANIIDIRQRQLKRRK